MPERGTRLGLRLTVGLATLLGRGAARLLVRAIAFYYTLFFAPARRAARTFLSRVGEPTGFFRCYRQVLRFAQCALDAVFLLRGEFHRFRFTCEGHENLAVLQREGRGVVLLGAHLGSFYSMRALAQQGYEYPLYPLIDARNARRFNELLAAVAPGTRSRVVEIEEGNVGFILRVRELVESGAFVGILADRVPERGPSAVVRFLGASARLPTGPYVLAHALGCPVYFTVGIYRDPDRYELHCVKFADRIELPRGGREEALAAHAQRYADLLERFAREAPDNWFNFYDFWDGAR
jgi:predicted LPLAT superfamily acyltransferase